MGARRNAFSAFLSAQNISGSEDEAKSGEVILYYATTCTITRCMAIIKTNVINILCLSSSIVCSKTKNESKNQKTEETMEKKEKRIKDQRLT